MTIVCAWCDKVMKKDETEDGEIISHSICVLCRVKLKSGGFEDADFPQPGLDPPPKTH